MSQTANDSILDPQVTRQPESTIFRRGSDAAYAVSRLWGSMGRGLVVDFGVIRAQGKFPATFHVVTVNQTRPPYVLTAAETHAFLNGLDALAAALNNGPVAIDGVAYGSQEA